MICKSLHESFVSKNEQLCRWYANKASGLAVPIYSSYDIRDSGFKVANVDGNIYPAGFNNICPTDKDYSIEVFAKYLDRHYDGRAARILLVTEEHTNNPYYWENVLTIKSLLESSGRKVMIAIPRRLTEPLQVSSVSGMSIKVVSAFPDSAEYKEFNPQLIISNNDFSEAYPEWSSVITTPVNPPRELGWYQRKKSRYFEMYNQLAEEFSTVAGVDPFQLTVRTQIFDQFHLSEEESMKVLADKVDAMLEGLRQEYALRKITAEPSVFIKNNAGTYGLAVVQVKSGQEVMAWNYKSRKKMKAAKGGRDVEEVIIQEGIPTQVKSDGATAEPVIYMIGCELAGGFLRTHKEKSETESLNSPGAVYKKLCVADLNIRLEGLPLENVYGWSAKLGLLAIGKEAAAMNVQFKDYQSADYSS